MAPPTEPLNLDVEAISGICGSISIACWVVVFSPQIIENFRRSSADSLSLQFIIIWLLGDVFNIIGGVLQGVLPTMIILAIYYTLADVVLLAQCFYYRGFTWRDEVKPPAQPSAPAPATTQQTALLAASNGNGTTTVNEYTSLLPAPFPRERRGSDWSERLTHLSPAVPLLDDNDAAPSSAAATPSPSTLQTIAWNLVAVLMVIGAGVAGWFLSRGSGSTTDDNNKSDGVKDKIEFDVWGQVFGYLCAVFYLGSRLPQLLLNWRRKSVEGLSFLFFLFACLGNLTYVLSIFAFEPQCGGGKEDGVAGGCSPGEAGHIYGQYILVNLSWLAGSLGTLFLDMAIFVQFFMYGGDKNNHRGQGREVDSAIAEEDEEETSIDGDRWERPILERVVSDLSE